MELSTDHDTSRANVQQLEQQRDATTERAIRAENWAAAMERERDELNVSRAGLEERAAAVDFARDGAVARANRLNFELVAAQAILRAPSLVGSNRTLFFNMAAHLSRDMEVIIARSEESNVALIRSSYMDSVNMIESYFQDDKLKTEVTTRVDELVTTDILIKRPTEVR